MKLCKPLSMKMLDLPTNVAIEVYVGSVPQSSHLCMLRVILRVQS